MHFTPGFESQARARAVDTGAVVEPPPVVELAEPEERVVVGDEPRGGNVTLDVASSPPHAAPTSAITTTTRASGHRRCRRGPAAATERSTSSRYCLTGAGWWSSRTRHDQAVAGAPDAFAGLALRSEFRAGHGRDKRDPLVIDGR